MSAFRYWRLNTRVYPQVHVLIAEIQMRTTVGGANVIGGGIASASSFEPVTNTPDHAIDGDPNTDWGQGLRDGQFRAEYPEWWQYDFGAGNEKDIVEVYVQGRITTNVYNPPSINIARSNDGVTWENCSYPVSMFNLPAGQPVVIPIEPVAIPFPWRIAPPLTRIETNWPPTPTMGARVTARILRSLPLDGSGLYRIEGTVAIDDEPTDIPVRRRVRLFRRLDGVLVAETFSDAITGAYAFTGLKLQKYFVVAHDDDSNIYNATIKDAITPELV